jgi:hypothetical protein
VRQQSLAGLPEDFTARAPETDARVTFVAGKLNHCFLYESQVRSFEFFDRHQPGRHALHLFDTYAHLDMFMGQYAARDVYPAMAQGLT